MNANILGTYILEGKIAVLCTNIEAWAKWLLEASRAERVVGKDTVGKARVSTVFLGMDHQWGDGPPLLFETMVFDGPLDGEMERCSTWEEAEAQHQAMVERVKASGGESQLD